MSAPKGRSILRSRTLPSSIEAPTRLLPAHPPEARESEDDEASKPQPFRFLRLPSELRNKVYRCMFCGTPDVIDLDPDNLRNIHRKIVPIFLVSKQLHHEASHIFYSTHTVRIFPTYPGRFFKTKKPLLARLSPSHRSSITAFQLRLGPGWDSPPRGWVVNDALGLKDAVNVRILKCFIELDPSDNMFSGFRWSINYPRFCRKLLEEILAEVPSISEIQFDAYSSVKKNGAMMRELLEVARNHVNLVSWGLERGWDDEDEDDGIDEKLLVKELGGLSLSRGVTALAKERPNTNPR